MGWGDDNIAASRPAPMAGGRLRMSQEPDPGRDNLLFRAELQVWSPLSVHPPPGRCGRRQRDSLRFASTPGPVSRRCSGLGHCCQLLVRRQTTVRRVSHVRPRSMKKTTIRGRLVVARGAQTLDKCLNGRLRHVRSA